MGYSLNKIKYDHSNMKFTMEMAFQTICSCKYTLSDIGRDMDDKKTEGRKGKQDIFDSRVIRNLT